MLMASELCMCCTVGLVIFGVTENPFDQDSHTVVSSQICPDADFSNLLL